MMLNKSQCEYCGKVGSHNEVCVMNEVLQLRALVSRLDIVREALERIANTPSACAGRHMQEIARDALALSHDGATTQPQGVPEMDALRWRKLPAHIEEFQIDYVGLKSAIDASLGCKHDGKDIGK